MTSRHIGTLAVFVGLLLLLAAAAIRAQESPGPDELVDALNSVFGRHPGVRAAHAKGICVVGMFNPSPRAPSLSKAPQFATPVPIIGRFSLGGGNPQAADNAQDNARGLALRFDLREGASTDLVMISAPIFLAKSPQIFVEFLQAVGSGDQAKLDAFFEAHPESTRHTAWLTSHPVPASYGGVNYWGVHAFTFTNGVGESKLIKYKAIPAAGELGLTPEEAKAKGPDFYKDELEDRLAKGPVVFDLVAILGQQGDPSNDPTERWSNEDSRPTAPLGKITIDTIAPDTTCDEFSFLPGNVAEGIAGPTDDPVFAARSPAYTVSLIRRSQQ